MEIIILAGGKGTRLASVVKDLPKPMADINGKPFLEILLDYCKQFNPNQIILSVGYKYESIQSYFGNSYKEMPLVYEVEHEALGTGGGIKAAMKNVKSQDAIVLNGDTFFDINLATMLQEHQKTEQKLSIALKKMFNFDRYGSVDLDGSRITAFNEKQFQTEAWINAGAYVMSKDLLLNSELPEKFSLETEVFEKQVNNLVFKAYKEDAYFIDIGIPEDLEKFKKDQVLRNKN